MEQNRQPTSMILENEHVQTNQTYVKLFYTVQINKTNTERWSFCLEALVDLLTLNEAII